MSLSGCFSSFTGGSLEGAIHRIEQARRGMTKSGLSPIICFSSFVAALWRELVIARRVGNGVEIFDSMQIRKRVGLCFQCMHAVPPSEEAPALPQRTADADPGDVDSAVGRGEQSESSRRPPRSARR